jgi:hypothetical protein
LRWGDLSRHEADLLALRQEHEPPARRSTGQPNRWKVVGRSTAWVSVWITIGFSLWHAMPS